MSKALGEGLKASDDQYMDENTDAQHATAVVTVKCRLEVECEFCLEGAGAWTDVVHEPGTRGHALNAEKHQLRHPALCGLKEIIQDISLI